MFHSECDGPFEVVQIGEANTARETYERVVDLYEAWHAAEPGQSYDAKAVQWRAKLANEVNSNEQDD